MVGTILRGGLGNNLFQMACLYSHAKRHDLKYAIPLEVENPHYVGQKPYKFSGLNYCDKVPDLPRYKEPFFHYQEIPPIDNIVLDGYWQSHKYAEPHLEEFIKDLELPIFPIRRETWCSINVRRGDYLKLPDYHPFVGEKYLKDAVDMAYNQFNVTRFVVTSNDPEWCYEFFKNGRFNSNFVFEISEGRTEIEDLVLGAQCFMQILSNGTFSLWQHYLNPFPMKICIAPQRWFGPKLDHNTQDIYPPSSIIIPNE